MGIIINSLDLSVNLGKITLKNPILTASGTFGYTNEYDDFIEVKNLGAVVTKAISLKPREGNNWQRIFETTGGMINSIGLENLGIEGFINQKLPILTKNNIDFIMNIAGTTINEYIELTNICENNNIKAIEINVSCPNVKSGCLEFGTDETSIHKLISEVRNVYNGCLIVKLTPNVTSIEKIAIAAQNAGADCVSAINTVKAMGIKIDFINGKFKKNVIRGGLSGQAIKPIALGVIDRLYNVIDIPIIGMGGIYSLSDIFEFFSVGAAAIQIGTANFTHPDISEKLLNELQDFMKNNKISTLDELKEQLRGA